MLSDLKQYYRHTVLESSESAPTYAFTHKITLHVRTCILDETGAMPVFDTAKQTNRP
jgi:hypothetical protein